MKRLFLNIKEYKQKHMWVSFVFSIGITVLIVVIIMQNYLKKEYIQYLREKTYVTESNLLSAVNQNVEYLLRNYIQVGSEIAVDSELEELVDQYINSAIGNKIEASQLLYDRIRLLSSYSQWISGIAVISEAGLEFQFDRLDYTNKSLWNEENHSQLIHSHQEIQQLIKQEQIPRYILKNTPITHPAKDDLKLFHVYLPLKGNKGFDKVEYTLVISFNAEALSDSLKIIEMNSDNIAIGYISNKNEQIVFHSDQNLIGNQKEVYGKENYVNMDEPLGNLGWTMNISIDEDKLLEEVDVIYNKGFIFYLLIFFVIIVFLISLISWVQRPINEIQKSINQVKKGDMKTRIDVQGKHEIWQLAEEFNQMICSVTDMNQKVEEYHLETLVSLKKQKEAEREALESQINAHFIFNTLAGINYDALEAGHHKISMQIKTLSNILRYSFDQNQEVFLFQEIAWVEQYLYLQKSRLEDVFSYEIRQDIQTTNWPCRKLMLQPFVENSIIHGFKGYENGGKITITTFCEDRYVHVVIDDNGRGMDIQTKKSIHRIISNPIITKENDVGIGISNVLTRMYMFYGEELRVKLTSSENAGTRFEFILPKPL